MKIIPKWQLNKENVSISACAIDPVHDHMIVGVGKTIIVVNVESGEEIKRCEKHTAEVTCLGYRKDGLWFASGGKDNVVYLWDVKNLAKPTNKISFTDPIIQVSYNPCILTLIALSKTNLALYRESPSKAGTNKISLSNTAVCMNWSSDGVRLAIGFENGTVSLRDKDYEKESKNLVLNPNMQERIWCISFSSTRYINKEYVLYVGTWEKNLYIIELFNYTVVECKRLNYDPISISLFKDDYFLLGSNNNEVNFYTKEATFVSKIKENITDWVLSIKSNSKNNSFAVCSNDGKILYYKIDFQVVHGIYNEKYAYRQNLLDIVVHNLITSTKLKIKCKKYIRKIAVYQDQVAALTTNKIMIYRIVNDEVSKTPIYNFKWEDEVNLLLLTSKHILVCYENRLLLHGLESETIEREWSFDSEIKYLRVLGGAKGRETLIGGLTNGEIFLIYIDNQFPVMIYQHDIPIKVLDINCNRKKLAIVDDNNDLMVIDIATKTIQWKDEKAKSVSFNSEIEDMIAYWNDGNVYIKTADFPSISEKMNGLIVGFRGSKVFLLQSQSVVNVLDISHSTTIMRYCDKKDFENSYKVACLGATREEWTYLGFEALLNFDFMIALNCFKKLQDMRLINLALKLEVDKNDKSISEEALRGDILCNMGKYEKAADMYIKGGNPEKAVEMYTLLRRFAEAMEIKKKHMTGKNSSMSDDLLLKQADWLYDNSKYIEAADLYWILNRKKKAIEVYGEKGMLDKLIDICRGLNKEDSSDLISLIGHYFKKSKHYQYASEAYLKLGDQKALVILNIELGRWEQALLLAQQTKSLLEYCYLQYAEHLILLDKFKEAQEAYKKAGRTDLSIKLLERLIDNAVYEKRFKDGTALFFRYANDALTLIEDFTSRENKHEMIKLKNYKDALDLADILNAYDIIYKYIEEPFSSDLLTKENTELFNVCRFLVNKMNEVKSNNKLLKMISPAYIYYALAFLAKQLEAYKTARFSFEKLNTLKFPQSWQHKIDYEIMSIRSKPYFDKDNSGYVPMCYRCLNTNTILNPLGDFCSICLAPFIRSPVTKEILPLVEFRPIDGINDDKAIEVISTNNMDKIGKTSGLEKRNSMSNSNVNSLVFIHEDNSSEDIFGMKLVEWCESRMGKDEYKMFRVDMNVMKTLKESEIFVIDMRKSCKSAPVRFYKNRTKDVLIHMCKFCNRFFRTEEYEDLYLRYNNSCPLCRNSEE